MTDDEKRKFQNEKAKAVLKAYKQGFRHALQAYAWWNDGHQYVGSGTDTLAYAIEHMESAYTFSPPRI